MAYTSDTDKLNAIRALLNNDPLDVWDIEALEAIRDAINTAETRGWEPVMDDEDDGQPDEMQEWHDVDPDC